MKFFAVLLLAGLALAYAVPVPLNEEVSLDDVEELHFLLHSLSFEAEGDDKTKLEKKLHDRLDQILEEMEDSINEGKTFKEDTMKQLREIREKMKELNIDIGNKAKEQLEKMKEKTKEFWKRILDKLAENEHEKRSIKDEIIRTLREGYDRILKRMKDHMEKGNEMPKGFTEKLKGFRERFGKIGNMGEFDQKLKDLLNDFTGKPREAFEKFLEKIGISRSKNVEYADGDSSDLARRLRENFQEVVQKIKDALENGKGFQEALEKLREICQKIRDLKVDVGEKGREMVKKLKEKVREYFDRLVGKFTDKREINFKDLLKKLKEKINNHFDSEKIEEKIEQYFGKGSDVAEKLIKMLKEKKERLLKIIDLLIGEKQNEKRSIKEVYDRVKNYFRDLKIELKEKFSKFGEYAKEKYETAFESGKDRVENLKKLAREFINDTKVISKDVAVQAKGFFEEYRDDLGVIFEEVKGKVRDIMKNN